MVSASWDGGEVMATRCLVCRHDSAPFRRARAFAGHPYFSPGDRTATLSAMRKCFASLPMLLIALASTACGGSASSSDAGDGSPPRIDSATPSDATPDSSRDSATPDGATSPDGAVPAGSLSARYPGDVGLADDPSVLFFDDFEAGWGRWDAPTADTDYLHLEASASEASAGDGYLRSTVTTADLEAQMYIGASPRFAFSRRVPTVYWRFYARFPEISPPPHHWVRMAAGNASYDRSGIANTVPPGDEGFWFDFDANNRDEFSFYTYWHEMRSGRCNDGTAVPGCAGDQGTTYHYGNTFRPQDAAPFPRDTWLCIELRAEANTVGESDGSLAFWVDDRSIGDYGPGRPDGTWLRDQFHEGGCEFSACTPPAPFEGFDFRTSDEVGFKAIFLDSYYERDSSARRRTALEERGLTVSDRQTVLYDDVVVATERIGCRQAL